MAMRNKITVPFEFGGEHPTVEATFEVVNAMEQRPSFSFGAVAQGVDSGTAKVTDLAWMIAAAASASGYNVTYNDAGDAIMSTPQGMLHAANFARKFLGEAFAAGPSEPVDDESEDGDEGKA